jgi:hypothetical protein
VALFKLQLGRAASAPTPRHSPPQQLQQLRKRREVVVRATPIFSAAFMSMPITWPPGASRSWPWQATSTSQALCSWQLIKACSR